MDAQQLELMANLRESLEHTELIGSFYMACAAYVRQYKIGGNQRLQKIIGKDMFYKIGKHWMYNNSKVICMEFNDLFRLKQNVQIETRKLEVMKNKSFLRRYRDLEMETLSTLKDLISNSKIESVYTGTKCIKINEENFVEMVLVNDTITLLNNIGYHFGWNNISLENLICIINSQSKP